MIDQQLLDKILSFKYDPLGFVLFAFPWSVKNKPLAKFKGPRRWQMEEFEKIRAHLEKHKDGLAPVLRLALSSGRGTGKSAFLAMLDCWFMSCWIGGTNIKTANTETQLRSRTMAELGKWHQMMINRNWFEKTSMTLRPTKAFAKLLNEQLGMDTQYYYTDAQTWSEENPDAFAGAHSQVGMVVQFDEASGIPDPIWPVTAGFFTDEAPLRLWVVISNPRRNTGQFYDCFHNDSHLWNTKYIDSRDVEGLDAQAYQYYVDKYGEDHDTTRVEVKGMFPRIGSNQFIGREVVEDAATREIEKDEHAPLLMGVDVARFGDDASVVRFRRGRDARSIPPVEYRALNTMELSMEVARLIDRFNPDVVFVDGGGVGGGVVDRLKELGYRVTEVQSGERARDNEKYMNRRVEMWGEMRDWLVFGAIDDHPQLVQDLTGPEYDLHLKGQLKLEPKDSMKKRGLKSPDQADALALTFAEPVARVDMNLLKRRRMFNNRSANTDYDVFGG